MVMTALNQITQLARSLLVQGEGLRLDDAIAEATDLVFEQGDFDPTLEDAGLRQQVQQALVGYGSLDNLINDTKIEEIWINSPEQVFIARDSKVEKVELNLDALAIRQTVEKMLRDSGRRLDRSEPFVDATLANGSRLHVVIPDVTSKHWAVNIRKFPQTVLTLSDLVAKGALTHELQERLVEHYRAGRNILISGATQAGKTTILCALLEESLETERLISIEETFEIRTTHKDWVAMQAKQANLEGVGEITLRRLVREALRMRPSRLVIGEVRQAEALDLLIALNSGISGLCTIHANSALEAIEKLKLLPLLAGENIPAKFVSKSVKSNIDLVIHSRMDANGKRRIVQVLEAIRTGTKSRWQEVSL
jgi:pilus assembly protein CpaF